MSPTATPVLVICSVARTVDPKRKKVAESEKNLRLAQKELAKIKVSHACQACMLPMHDSCSILGSLHQVGQC